MTVFGFKSITKVVGEAAHLASKAGKAVVAGAVEAKDFANRVLSGNVGTQAVPMPEVIKKVIAGSSVDWHNGVYTTEGLARAHDQIGRQITSISSGLEAAWAGKGAMAAQARFKPFADVVATAAQSFSDNSNNLSNMAHYFDNLQAAFRTQPLPGRPDKGFFDVATPWDTDTENKVKAYNALVKQHLERYNKYAAAAETGRSQLNLNYGRMDPLAGVDFVITGGPGTSSGSGGGSSTTPSFTGTSTAANPGITDPHPRSPQHPTPQHLTPSLSGPPSRTPGVDIPAFDSGPSDFTRTAGFVPPEVGGAQVPFGGGGSGGNTVGVGPGVGGANGFDGGSGGRSSGVGGLSGRATGTGVPGMSATGRGMSGAAAGRAGTAGAPAFAGPPGGRGRGEDDEEHRDKYAQADDTIFNLDGDKVGDVLRDPHTGLPVVPPTIGA